MSLSASNCSGMNDVVICKLSQNFVNFILLIFISPFFPFFLSFFLIFYFFLSNKPRGLLQFGHISETARISDTQYGSFTARQLDKYRNNDTNASNE